MKNNDIRILLTWMEEKLDNYLHEADNVYPEKILMNKKLFEKYDKKVVEPNDFYPILTFNGIPIQFASWMIEDDIVFLAPE